VWGLQRFVLFDLALTWGHGDRFRHAAVKLDGTGDADVLAAVLLRTAPAPDKNDTNDPSPVPLLADTLPKGEGEDNDGRARIFLTFGAT